MVDEGCEADVSFWLVTYAYLSETATVITVEAEDEMSARERARAMVRKHWPHDAPCIEERFDVVPVRDGLVVEIDAPH
jgi:hypothetical protein